MLPPLRYGKSSSHVWQSPRTVADPPPTTTHVRDGGDDGSPAGVWARPIAGNNSINSAAHLRRVASRLIGDSMSGKRETADTKIDARCVRRPGNTCAVRSIRPTRRGRADRGAAT